MYIDQEKSKFFLSFSKVDLVGMDGYWIRLGSVHLAYDLDIPSQSLVSLVGSFQTANIPIILGCDANAHHDHHGVAQMQTIEVSPYWILFLHII